MTLIQKLKNLFIKKNTSHQKSTRTDIIKPVEADSPNQDIDEEMERRLIERAEEQKKREEGWEKERQAAIKRVEEREALKKIRAEEQRLKAEEQRKLDKTRAEEQRLKAEEQRKFDKIRAEEQRLKAEEQRKLEESAAKERELLELEQIRYIHSIYNDGTKFVEYLQEVHKFNLEYGKDVKCGICSAWGDEVELYCHRGQTYCEEHLPLESYRQTGRDRKIVAGKHGSSRDYIKY